MRTRTTTATTFVLLCFVANLRGCLSLRPDFALKRVRDGDSSLGPVSPAAAPPKYMNNIHWITTVWGGAYMRYACMFV